jgi:hypothetical protein
VKADLYGAFALQDPSSSLHFLHHILSSEIYIMRWDRISAPNVVFIAFLYLGYLPTRIKVKAGTAIYARYLKLPIRHCYCSHISGGRA